MLPHLRPGLSHNELETTQVGRTLQDRRRRPPRGWNPGGGGAPPAPLDSKSPGGRPGPGALIPTPASKRRAMTPVLRRAGGLEPCCPPRGPEEVTLASQRRSCGRPWGDSLRGATPGVGAPGSGDAGSRLHCAGDERVLISLEPLWSPRALHALIGKCLRPN